MYKLSYGLFVLTAKDGEKDNGCIINTTIQAASEPNQLSICVNKANYTHDMIMETGEFNVSVISKNAKFDLFKHFGFQTVIRKIEAGFLIGGWIGQALLPLPEDGIIVGFHIQP